jgi:hypothetical protein
MSDQPGAPAGPAVAVVLYESMFGNTRQVAEAIADGLARQVSARAVAVTKVAEVDVRGTALMVVGGPTHAWGMSRTNTRHGAAQQAAKSPALTMEPGAEGPGIREWLDRVDQQRSAPTRFAAFDTRMRAPLGLSGSAARKIDRRLRHAGAARAAAAEHFIVSKDNRLVDGELEHARAWGERLGAQLAASQPSAGGRRVQQA